MYERKGLFWLSSYPKSGNTWFRIFLANLLNTSNGPINLNHIDTGMIASDRAWMDQNLGFDSALLSHDELDLLRSAVYKRYTDYHNKISYHKIHDAYTYLANTEPLIPVEGCLGVIYFIRNPLDIAISLANHLSCTIDKAIANMGNTKFAFCKDKYGQFNQLRQWLLSWSLHVRSWMEAKNLNLLILRYEDMKRYPRESFTKAVQFLQLDVTLEAIEKAISAAQIDKLQQLEALSGFNEKPAKAERFFRKGVVGDWRVTLTANQIQQIIQDHGTVMQMVGYLDQNNNPEGYCRI